KKEEYGVSVPFPPEVEAQKIRMEKPSQPSNEDKELSDFLELRKTDPKAAQYSADRLGLAKYKAEQIRVPASGQTHMAEQTVKAQAPVPGDFSKTGPDFLSTIPKQWQATVKKIGDYEEDATKVASMRGGMREQLMQWVNQYNPGY